MWTSLPLPFPSRVAKMKVRTEPSRASERGTSWRPLASYMVVMAVGQPGDRKRVAIVTRDERGQTK